MCYAHITGRVKYDVASGLTEAMVKPKHKHFPAITRPRKVGRLMRDVDEYNEGYFSVRDFLKIIHYVFARPSELRLAQWEEADFEKSIWIVPESCMKMRREHVVPLTDQVVSLLRELQKYSSEDKCLFPSIRAKSTVISDAAPFAALRKLGYDRDQMTLHGFRATADANLNELDFRVDVIETRLARKETDSVRLAYNRAQYMEERRKMMTA